MVAVRAAEHVTPTPSPAAGSPGQVAASVLAANTQSGRVDVAGVATSLNRLAGQDPALAAQVRPIVERALTPVQRGELLAAMGGRPSGVTTATAPDGRPITFAPDAPTVSQFRAAPAGSPERAFYDRLDGIWGDGRYATNDTPAIERGLADLQRGGLTLEQAESQVVPTGGTSPIPGTGTGTGTGATPAGGPGGAALALDVTQLALDVVGIFEPTPFADLTNTAISAGRGDWWGAGLSIVGVIPYVGDLAKLGKLGKWAETVSNAVSLAARDPGFRQLVEPSLRRISDAIGTAPLDSLPASARETLLGIKKDIDDLFAQAAPAGARLNGSTLVFDANRGVSATVNGVTRHVGDAPSVRTIDGRRIAQDVEGADVTLRSPRTFDSSVVNADGGVTYTKNGRSVTYDANGFPVFNAKADLLLDASHIASRNADDHFRAANTMVGDALRADPSLAQRLGLNAEQVTHLTKQPPNADAPRGLTWHHHQDTGRMQLVDRAEHAHFSGGHTGGMRLWGGGY